jgi:hypothetical protein
MGREGIEYNEIDIEQDPSAADFVMGVNGGNAVVPTLVFPDGSTRTLTTGTTGVDGSYSIPMLIGKSVSLRVLTEPSSEREASATSALWLTVARNLIMTPPTSVKSGIAFTISGIVLPRTAGVTITLGTTSEKIVGQATTTDAQGAFTLNVPAQARSIDTYHITLGADATWPVLASDAFSIIIR